MKALRLKVLVRELVLALDVASEGHSAPMIAPLKVLVSSYSTPGLTEPDSLGTALSRTFVLCRCGVSKWLVIRC
jgi:hypothetical protein